MAILIDGYNLLNVAGIFGRGRAGSSLERSRRALINFLASTLSPEEVQRTTVVFDAGEAPPGLPRQSRQAGILVHFASQYDDADALIEELIRADSAPRQLTVVSSDHRIQRAARRRKATAVDSDQWFDQTIKRAHGRGRDDAETADPKPKTPLSEVEIQHWLAQFGDISLEEPEASSPFNKSDGIERDSDPNEPPPRSDHLDLSNPFPPGYADDVIDDPGAS